MRAWLCTSYAMAHTSKLAAVPKGLHSSVLLMPHLKLHHIFSHFASGLFWYHGILLPLHPRKSQKCRVVNVPKDDPWTTRDQRWDKFYSVLFIRWTVLGSILYNSQRSWQNPGLISTAETLIRHLLSLVLVHSLSVSLPSWDNIPHSIPAPRFLPLWCKTMPWHDTT